MFAWKTKLRHMRKFLDLETSRSRMSQYHNERVFFLYNGLMEKRENRHYSLTDKGIRFRDKFIELYSIVFKSEADGRDNLLEATEGAREETPR